MGKILIKFKTLIYLFLFFQLSTTGLLGQESGTIKYLTMEEAILKALDKNHQVKASEFSLRKAEWETRHAWTLLFPVINFDSRYTWIDAQTFAERDFRRYLPPELANQIPQTVFQESYYSAFSLTVPVFNASLLNNLWVANSREDMTEQLDKSTVQQTIFEVISVFIEFSTSIPVPLLKLNTFLSIFVLSDEST